MAESKKVQRSFSFYIETTFFSLSYNLYNCRYSYIDFTDATVKCTNVIFQLHCSVLHIFFASLLPQFLICVHKNALNSLVPPC